jgi:CRISPR/Cas system endoribonuclease Cas6 (RAMP superfamily)
LICQKVLFQIQVKSNDIIYNLVENQHRHFDSRFALNMLHHQNTNFARKIHNNKYLQFFVFIKLFANLIHVKFKFRLEKCNSVEFLQENLV